MGRKMRKLSEDEAEFKKTPWTIWGMPLRQASCYEVARRARRLGEDEAEVLSRCFKRHLSENEAEFDADHWEKEAANPSRTIEDVLESVIRYRLAEKESENEDESESANNNEFYNHSFGQYNINSVVYHKDPVVPKQK